MPVIFTCLVCDLLNFHAREFPSKSETQDPGEIIVECTSYGLLEILKVTEFVLKKSVSKRRGGRTEKGV